MMRTAWLLVLLLVSLLLVASAQERRARPRETDQKTANQKEVVAQFAPIFYQGLGDSPRSDYITNFDFDGDWKGDNNWWNLDNRSFSLKAYVYYSLTETETHYFIHYATFHPRDYKAGLITSAVLETLMGEGLRRMGKDPTGGLADEIALSHENDLEGCLVVVEKRGKDSKQAAVQYIETMAHNRYLKYCPNIARAEVCEAIEMNGQRPLIFIEPKGHGPSRYTGDRQQLKNCLNGVIAYSYTGQAEDHDKINGKQIGYDLVSIYDTLWKQAQQGDNETYGESQDYQSRTILKFRTNQAAEKDELKLGKLGAAFRGTVGFKNKARPPWGWFDNTEKDRPLGEWFLDPASVIARHFNLGQAFSTAYTYNPYFKIGQ